MLSRDKRLPLDTWNQSGLHENVLGNQLSTFDSPRDHPQRIQSDDVQRERGAVPQATGTGTIFTRNDTQNRDTIPMPTFAIKPLTTSSTIPADLPQNYVVGQQRQQISELQFDKFPNPQTFLVWKIRLKNQVTTCSYFPSDAMLWFKEVEMVDFWTSQKSSRSVCGKDFPNFEMLNAKIASALNTIIQNSQFRKEGQSRGAPGSERGPFPSSKTDCLHDLRRADFSLLLFMMTIFRNSIQDGMKFNYQCHRFPPMIS